MNEGDQWVDCRSYRDPKQWWQWASARSSQQELLCELLWAISSPGRALAPDIPDHPLPPSSPCNNSIYNFRSLILFSPQMSVHDSFSLFSVPTELYLHLQVFLQFMLTLAPRKSSHHQVLTITVSMFQVLEQCSAGQLGSSGSGNILSLYFIYTRILSYSESLHTLHTRKVTFVEQLGAFK